MINLPAKVKEAAEAAKAIMGHAVSIVRAAVKPYNLDNDE